MNATEALDDYLLGLLAEAAPVEVPAPTPAAAKTDFTADLLAEMDADPAFAASTPAATPAPVAKTDFTADLLAEMNADPAFAAPAPAAVPAPVAKTDFTADLLAEMDADPAFAAPAPPATPVAAARSAPAAPIGPVARRTPPRAAALPPHIQAMFQPAPVVTDHQRRAAERSTRWLRLRCGEQTYALELLKVQEVVLPVPLLPLRGAARSMLGIMNLRGQVVPVMDLGLHLGAGAVASDAQTRVVVLEENGETMGLRVSAVEDVTSLSEQHIEPPDNTRLCRISNQLFRGVARLGQQPMILLDASELLH